MLGHHLIDLNIYPESSLVVDLEEVLSQILLLNSVILTLYTVALYTVQSYLWIVYCTVKQSCISIVYFILMLIHYIQGNPGQ